MLNRLKYSCCVAVCVILAMPAIVRGDEQVHPSTYGIIGSYVLSADSLVVGETLTVTWVVQNNENLDLTALYLSENLPDRFRLVNSSMRIGGFPIRFYYSGPRMNQVIQGYDAHRWVTDFPSEPDSLNNILRAGQTLSLRYKALCDAPGSYVLPHHSMCCFGDTTGIFTTSDSLTVEVVPAMLVPTLSEWGYIVLGLLILAVGTATLVRNRRWAEA